MSEHHNESSLPLPEDLSLLDNLMQSPPAGRSSSVSKTEPLTTLS